MMKKLLATLLIMAMSVSLLVGCGGSNDGDSNKGNSTNNEAGTNEDKDDDKQDDVQGSCMETVVYEAVNYNTGASMDCEITYNSSVLDRAHEIFDDTEPVTNITESPESFFHIESGTSYEVIVIPMCGSANEYYTIEKEGYEDYDGYKEVIFSELSTVVVGDIEVQTYTKKLVWEDDDTLDYQFWLVEFEDGVMLIQTYGSEEDLSIAQDSIKDLLVSVTLGGNEPKSSGNANNGDTENNGSTDQNAGEMSASDWVTPKIQIDGVVYTFPMEAQELVDNGWVMDNDFPVGARPGANAGIYFIKGDMELFTNVSSTTGVEQPMEEGEVCSMSFSNEYNTSTPVSFPGGLAIGSTKADVESILPSEFEYDADQQCFKYIYDDGAGKFDIKIYLTDDESVVDEITYTYWTR